MLFRLSTAAFALALGLAAQSTVSGFPDLNPSGGAGCNAIPYSTYFGPNPGSWTELTVISAFELHVRGVPVGSSPSSIAMAACGTGTLHIPQMTMRVGHVVPGATTFASALDNADVLVDTVSAGPVSWPCQAAQWSPVWSGTSTFAWDGYRDIALCVSVAGTTCTTNVAWTGTFMRENTNLRAWASGFNAAYPTSSGMSGLKSKWTWAPPGVPSSVMTFGTAVAGVGGAPTLSPLGAPTVGNPAFGLLTSGASGGSVAFLALSSTPAYFDIGVPGHPFALLVDPTPGLWIGAIPGLTDAWGAATWGLPVPQMPGLVGVAIASQVIVMDPTGSPTLLGTASATAGLIVTIGS